MPSPSRGRAGYYGARHRRNADAPWTSVLVGPAPDGRSLTAFVPVATGRAVAVRLHQALYATREAIDYQRATGGMDAFDAAVDAGVSRELTEAVVALVRGTEGARITSPGRPPPEDPEGARRRTEPVEFSPGDLPALRVAGARYLRDEPAVPVRITGAVVRLRRSGPRGAGVVRLRVLAGAEVAARTDRARRGGLPDRGPRPPGRTAAAGATGGWRTGAASGGSTGASEVAPVQVDEAERDRLMKSLHENVDFFEEACSGDD